MVSKKSVTLLVVSRKSPFLRIYTFIISDPLTKFRKWKFRNFGRKKGVPPLQQDFFSFFSRERYCLRIYTFIISDPLTKFRKWKFRNFGRKKGVPPLQQDFHQDFRSFPWKFKFSNFDNIENWKRFDFTQEMVRKLKIFTLTHRKVLVLEI